MNRICSGVVLAGTAFLLLAPAATARTTFDGRWTVLVVTEKGECDRAYRYDIEVADGTMKLADTIAVELRGKVTGNGVVTVSLQRGQQHAEGKGRLSPRSGRGSWQGIAPSGSCSGSWSAERR